MSDISGAMAAAASGLRAQTTRLRIAAENVANAASTAQTPEGDPFRRRIPVLQETTIKDASGAKTDTLGVRVKGAQDDPTPFKLQYIPGHPAADSAGMVKMPNVDPMVEMMDMREAARAYEANLSMIENARSMNSRALDLLRR